MAEMLPNLALIQQLSPKITADGYERMLHEMVPHNYFQMAFFEEGRCIAVSGYWIATKLYCDKYLEIDNFVVDEQYRGSGIGGKMVDVLVLEAEANQCKTVMLDAYVENFKAHGFYYHKGFIARGYHYLKFL